MHWHRESNRNCRQGSADQYQKYGLGYGVAEEVAYRATGGAAQNISMADMVAIRRRIQLGILCKYMQVCCLSGGRTGVRRADAG